MQLLTDYAQYYDEIFTGSGPTFHRQAFTRGGLSKRRQFELFAQLGLPSPPHGQVRELAAGFPSLEVVGAAPAPWLEEVYCVIYEDEYLHGGRGKSRLSLAEACQRHPQALASIFLPPFDQPVNFRHVRLGGIGIWLRQVGGAGEWQSNRRDSESVMQRNRHPGPPPIPRVLWAIDFLPSAQGLLAIDFNTAPDLTTLGETNTLTAGEILAELECAAANYPEHLNQF